MPTTTYTFAYSYGQPLKVVATNEIVIVKRQSVPTEADEGPPLSGRLDHYLCTRINGSGEKWYSYQELTTP